jgi:hypothetical protein
LRTVPTVAGSHYTPTLRGNGIKGQPPHGTEVAAPVDGDTVTIFLNEGTIEYWARIKGAWSLVATVPPGDGRHYNIPRPAMAVSKAIAPNVREVPIPQLGDTAITILSDDTVEYWSFATGAWVAVATVSPVTGDGTHYHILRPDKIESVAPSNTEIAAPKNGDTATVVLVNGGAEHWSFAAGAWKRVAGILPTGRNFNVVPRRNAIPLAPPTAKEASKPNDGDTATVFLNDGTVEFWIHAVNVWIRVHAIDPPALPSAAVTQVFDIGGALTVAVANPAVVDPTGPAIAYNSVGDVWNWNVTSTTWIKLSAPKPDGQLFFVDRHTVANAIAETEPTTTEIPTSKEGDTAIVLSKLWAECWVKSSTGWVQKIVIPVPIIESVPRSFNIYRSSPRVTLGREPSISEVESPIQNDTAIVVLSNGTSEFWRYFHNAWMLSATTAPGNRSSFVPRVDAIENVAPVTASELGGHPPKDSDTAVVFLSDGKTEYWVYGGNAGVWARYKAISRSPRNFQILRADSIKDAVPTELEIGSPPVTGDTAVVFYSDKALQFFTFGHFGGADHTWGLKA